MASVIAGGIAPMPSSCKIAGIRYMVAIGAAVFSFVYTQRSRNDGIGRGKNDQGMHGIKE
jgi:hypothetical protein